ncbi:MAG: dihydrolipoamide dehydrogenase, partial [Flavobacteriaceae bacterium]|nr:dihydrolipoamide dehydrogenase [Flavobacteriaceae bacterium]
KAGMKKAAIAAAKNSLELSKKAKNDAYIKMNTDSLKEWGAN